MRRNSQARAVGEAAVVRALKRRTAKRGTSKGFAYELGISESRLSHMRRRRTPMTEKVAESLGYMLAWVRAEELAKIRTDELALADKIEAELNQPSMLKEGE